MFNLLDNLHLLTDIDECTTETVCDPNGLCTNTEGSFGCQCSFGFVGDGFQCFGLYIHLLTFY